MCVEDEQVLVAGHQVGALVDRERDEVVVVWVSRADWGWTGRVVGGSAVVSDPVDEWGGFLLTESLAYSQVGESLRARRAPRDLHHQRDRSLEPATPQGSQDEGQLPSQEAAIKLLYFAIQHALPQWTRTRGWTKAMLAFKIQFGDRLPD